MQEAPGCSPEACPVGAAHTCVDELHMALQVAVDHEHLVAARVGTGPLADLLVVLLYVLLWRTVTLFAQLSLMAPAAAPGPCSAP